MSTIYFSGSISGGRKDTGLYRIIVDRLTAAGHRVLAGAVASESVGAHGETLESAHIFERDLAWLREAAAEGGCVVAEVSMPSLGVGYEIGYARYSLGMPVICLYRSGHTARCSAMISGDSGIELIVYDDAHFDFMMETLLSKLATQRRTKSP